MFEVEKARIIDAGRTNADERWSFPVHSHLHWEFVYFARGSGRVTLPEGIIKPHTYDVVIYPPGTPHSEETNPYDPQQSLFLVIEVPGSNDTTKQSMLSDQSGEIGWVCEKIVNEVQSQGITPLAEAYARVFLCLVERVWKNGRSVQYSFVDYAMQYMQAHYQENITLQTLADITHVSKSHLIHVFDAKLGDSPLRCLQKIRIEAARRLLLTTNASVNTVARQAGFTDPLYFSKVFKRATGVSPTLYREINCTIQSISDTI